MFEVDVEKERDKGNYILLEDKIDNFYDWVEKNYRYEEVMKIKKFIDDLVIWYENSRPTKDEFIRLVELCLWSNTDTNSYMGIVDNSKMYPIRLFIESNQENYLKRPIYSNRIFRVLIGNIYYEFSLTHKGRVRNFGKSKFTIQDRDGKVFELNDIKINEFIWFLEYETVDLKDCNDFAKFRDVLEYILMDYKKQCEFKDGLLDTVMYRLIERGGEFCGATRGYLFAKEFGRDVSIPLKYGFVDTSEATQKVLIEDYLNNGGNVNLDCYSGYFERNKKYDELYGFKLIDELHNLGMYTKEEHELHQRLVNALSATLTIDKVNEAKQEEVTRKRIERKLNKRKGE